MPEGFRSVEITFEEANLYIDDWHNPDVAMCVTTTFYEKSLTTIAVAAVKKMKIGAVFIVVGQLLNKEVGGLKLIVPKDEPLLCDFSWGKSKVWFYRRVPITR